MATTIQTLIDTVRQFARDQKSDLLTEAADAFEKCVVHLGTMLQKQDEMIDVGKEMCRRWEEEKGRSKRLADALTEIMKANMRSGPDAVHKIADKALGDYLKSHEKNLPKPKN